MKRSLIMTTVAALLLTGCTSLTQVISMQAHHVTKCDRSRGIVLIVGAHRDAPAPSLDQRVACQVAAAVSAGRLVLLVEATGQPVTVKPQLLSVHGGTLAQQGHRVRRKTWRALARPSPICGRSPRGWMISLPCRWPRTPPAALGRRTPNWCSSIRVWTIAAP